MDVVVGRIGRAHGVRGELAVEVRTDDPARRFAVGARLQTDPVSAGPLTVVASRPHSGRLLVRFEEVSDRSGAEGLRGVLLTAEALDTEPTDDPEEYFDHQLVGLTVADHTGAVVGEVVEVVHNPAHELLRVRRVDGGDALVPFVAALVPEVDIESRRVTVADRPGLLDPQQMG